MFGGAAHNINIPAVPHQEQDRWTSGGCIIVNKDDIIYSKKDYMFFSIAKVSLPTLRFCRKKDNL